MFKFKRNNIVLQDDLPHKSPRHKKVRYNFQISPWKQNLYFVKILYVLLDRTIRRKFTKEEFIFRVTR